MTKVEVNQVILERLIELSIEGEWRSFVNCRQRARSKYVCLVYHYFPALEHVWHVKFSKDLFNA